MELLSLVGGPNFYRIVGGESLIVNGAPSVVFNALIPSFDVAILRLVELHINSILALGSLDSHVISWGESVYVNDTSVRENLVVD